jgi:sulfate permease, SulP family
MFLDVYGSLFFAGARTLEARLPDPLDTHRPAVVLRLRGRTNLGATFFKVLGDYVDKVAQAGGRVFLSGVDPALHKQYGSAGPAAVDDAIEVFEATPILNESSRQAYARATDWLAQPDQDNETP